MQQNTYIYTFKHDKTETALCQLESKYLFNQPIKNQLLFSKLKIAPSSSAFIKKRIDVFLYSKNYEILIDEVKKQNIFAEGFKVEYVVLKGDSTPYKIRLNKLRDIGYRIEGNPDYYNPTITYALCYYEEIWYFGILIKNNFNWHQHKQKPYSYSNSISIHIAKALVNIAAAGNKKRSMLDACCGAGTILLEACFAGYKMEGCDINWKLCRDARKNLTHFNYTSTIYRSDIRDLYRTYDAVIVDLPYNLLSKATDNDIAYIIASVAAITDRMVIVSTADIAIVISNIGFKLLDYCSVPKRGKISFARKIWVCEKER